MKSLLNYRNLIKTLMAFLFVSISIFSYIQPSIVKEPNKTSSTIELRSSSLVYAQSEEGGCPGGYCVLSCSSTSMSCCVDDWQGSCMADYGGGYLDCDGWVIYC